jgi:purine-binding chemotaxis protein CheW
MEAVATKTEATEEKLFLTFVLGNEVYGIEIFKVREIIGFMDITTVPRTPDYLKGVINLRGKVIPIVDLRSKFSMPEVEHTQKTCVIVVEVGAYSHARGRSVLWHNNTPQQIGIIVDSVSEVSNINSGEIEDAPQFGQKIDSNFILGLGKTKERIIILLDIEEVLSSEEIEMVGQLVEN